MSSNEAAASWYILHEGKKKEGPYTLAQLLAIVPTPKMRIRQAHDSTWHAWVNASQYYPELAIVGLVQTVDPLLLREETFIELLLDTQERQKLISEMRAQEGRRVPLSEHVARLAPRCTATPEQLRQVIAALLQADALETLHWLVFHPDIPEDVLLQLLAQGRCLTDLGHRRGPQALLERLASEHRYSEAITTLALYYYAADHVSVEEFAGFVEKYQADYMLRSHLRTARLAPEKRRRALDIIGAEEPPLEYAAGMTELHYAAYCGDHDGVLEALWKGLDVNGRDQAGWTPLHWVVDMGMVAGEREQVVATLMRAGADVNAHDREGSTPLMVACRAGNGDLVRQLVAAGADLQVRDNAGRTALIEAACYGNPQTVAFLWHSGANTSARTVDGKTALDWARAYGWDTVVQVLSAEEA
jgi:hypothetical protein